MTAFDTWESYFYPPPDERTMRNFAGVRDRDILERWEFIATVDRQQELAEDSSIVQHTYDAAHLRQIHHHLFQDVYEWAGQYRTVGMAKGAGGGFANPHNGDIDLYLEVAHDLVMTTSWERLDQREFADHAARVFAHVNQAHPFREGNGRATKTFMHHVAMNSQFRLEFEQVPTSVWNALSDRSRPQSGIPRLSPELVAPVFFVAATERTESLVQPQPQSAAPRSASYPQSAAQATQHAARKSAHQGRAGSYMPGRGYGSGGVER